MKNSTTAIMLLLLLTACKIKKDDLEPVEKTIINGQLFSYGPNTPISGATINSKKCTSDTYFFCTTWDQKTSVSAADGSFNVHSDYLDNIRVLAPGYWSYIDEYSNGYILLDGSATPRGQIHRFYENGKLQKIAIDLVPEVKLNIHVKNISAISDSIHVYLVGEGQLGYGITASLVYLHKGIDTTFEYTAFGNLNNRFSIKKGIGWIAFDSTLSSKELFLAAGNNNSLVINF